MTNNKIKYICIAILTIYSIYLSFIVFSKNDNKLSKVENLDMVEKSQRQVDADIQEALRRRVIEYGDTVAYKSLIEQFGSSDNLLYSIFMADKHGYPDACYLVYCDIAEILYQYNKIMPDSIVSCLTISCLRKGRCYDDLGRLYTTGYMVEKDTLKGRFYIEKAFREEGEEYINRLMKFYLSNKMFDYSNFK